MTAETLSHRTWCTDPRDMFHYDDGTLLILRCHSCRAELVRHRRPAPPDDDEPSAA
jgi:hypothetical protein